MGIHRAVGRLPVLVVIIAPFAFESFRVTGPIPKLRFLQMDRFGSGIQGALHADAKEFAVVLARRHVIDVAAVADLLAVAFGLGLILVVHPVEAAIEVILILSPRHARHHVNAIAVVPPRGNPRRQIGVNTINNRHVGTQICPRTPRLARLKTSALQCRPGVRRTRPRAFLS